jgi:hypothetical protein
LNQSFNNNIYRRMAIFQISLKLSHMQCEFFTLNNQSCIVRLNFFGKISNCPLEVSDRLKSVTKSRFWITKKFNIYIAYL